MDGSGGVVAGRADGEARAAERSRRRALQPGCLLSPPGAERAGGRGVERLLPPVAGRRRAGGGAGAGRAALHEGNPEQGVAMLAEAVAKVRKPDDWKNVLVELANVRELFEQAIAVCRGLLASI